MNRRSFFSRLVAIPVAAAAAPAIASAIAEATPPVIAAASLPAKGFHAAAGFGDLMPGHFTIPQNPIRRLEGLARAYGSKF